LQGIHWQRSLDTTGARPPRHGGGGILRPRPGLLPDRRLRRRGGVCFFRGSEATLRLTYAA